MEQIKKYLRPVAFGVGVPFFKIAYRKILNQQKVFILMYHRVDQQARPFFEIVVKPEIFERQIRFLKRNFEIVDLSDLRTFESKRVLKRDLGVLTFDDGYRGNYTYALPVLKQYNVPTTIFLATGCINTNQLLWYDRLSWILYKSKSTLKMVTLQDNEIPHEIAKEIISFFHQAHLVSYVFCE